MLFGLEIVGHSTTGGEAGNLKLPHAISLHGIKVLPFLAMLLVDGILGDNDFQAITSEQALAICQRYFRECWKAQPGEGSS